MPVGLVVRVTVAGIPALAEVTHYYEGSPGRGLNGPVESYQDIEAPESEEVDFSLRDRKGYKAAWLERKLEDWCVLEDVQNQVLAGLHNKEGFYL